MDRPKATLLVVVLFCGLLAAGAVLASGTPTIERYVVGGGGGHAEVPPYTLDGTLGQALVGLAGDEPYGLCSGFWCEGWGRYRVYLPLAVRGSP